MNPKRKQTGPRQCTLVCVSGRSFLEAEGEHPPTLHTITLMNNRPSSYTCLQRGQGGTGIYTPL